MTTMTIRDLGDGVEARLRLRANAHGRSIEDEARAILRSALATDTPQPDNLAAAIRRRMTPLGGVDLAIAPREPIRETADLDR